MISQFRRLRVRQTPVILTGILFTVLASACGAAKSPAAPSGSTPPASTGSTASISGTVQSAPSGLNVAVVGTTIAANADAAGNFALAGVPTGDLQLKFSGGGAEATVAVAEVQPAQNITLQVALSGTTASVETEVRDGGGEAELEARIEALPPTTAAGSFKAGGRLVRTNASTTFEQQGNPRSFSDLTVGMRVHVKGTPAGSDILAERIQMQSANAGPPAPAPPATPAPAPGNKEVEARGTIAGLTGSASAFQFTFGGATIFKGDGTTSIVGKSNTVLTFIILKNGLDVEVKGTDDGGVVKLTRIHIEDGDDDAPTPPASPATPATPTSFTGKLTAKSGTAPNLTLTVGGNTVKTDSKTVFKNRGNVVPLDGLAVGQTLDIEGTKQADGSVLAKEISLEDDEDNEAEVEGTMSAPTGTCPAISFTIATTKVTTTAATEFKDIACSALKKDLKVRADGSKQADGSLLARRVRPR